MIKLIVRVEVYNRWLLRMLRWVPFPAGSVIPVRKGSRIGVVILVS